MKSLREKLAAARTGILADTRGLSTVEYVIILVLVAMVALATWSKFGSMVQTKLNSADQAYSANVIAGTLVQ